MPTSHIGMPGFEFWLFYSIFQLPAVADAGRQQMMAQVVGSLAPTQETQIKCQSSLWPAPVLSIARFLFICIMSTDDCFLSVSVPFKQIKELI